MDAVDVLLNGFSVVKDNPKVILVYLILSALSFASASPLLLTFLSNKATIVNIANTNSFTPGVAKVGAELVLSGILAAVLLLVIALFIQPMFVGMIIEAGFQSASRKYISLNEAFDKAKSRYVKLVWTNFLVSVIEILGALAVVILLVIILLAGINSTVLALFLLISAVIAIAYAVLAAILLYLAMPAVMAENKSGIAALRISYNITRKDKAGIFAIFVVVGIISFLASTIIGNIMGALGSKTIFLFPTAASIAIFAISVFILLLINGFVYSWLLVTSALMYLSYKRGTLGRKSDPVKKAV